MTDSDAVCIDDDLRDQRELRGGGLEVLALYHTPQKRATDLGLYIETQEMYSYRFVL